MLILRVEYLTGVCMATAHDDPSRSTPEWPPHPDRLFSALVAAAAEPQTSGETHIPPPARGALEWLAEQAPPELHAPRAHQRTAPYVPMPSNPHDDEVWQKKRKKDGSRAPLKNFDMKTLLPLHRKNALLPIPAVVPDESAVYFRWPDADPEEHLGTLRSICDRVTYLGRSRSLVRVTVENQAPAATHVPDPLGLVQLRVPGPERLDYLIDKYERDGGKPAPSPPQRYRRAGSTSPIELPGDSLFRRVWVFRLLHPRNPAPPIEASLRLTRAFRKALIKQVHEQVCGCSRWDGGVPSHGEAGGCYDKIPGVISGHQSGGTPLQAPHVGFAPLPFVHPTQRHADGTVKGLAVLVPDNLKGDALTLLARGVRDIDRLALGRAGAWCLELVSPDDPPMATLDHRSWTAPSRVWTTATPMVFGHFPKERNGGEPQVILDSLQLVGVDPGTVVDIATDRHSPLHGAAPIWCFDVGRDRASGERRRWVRHVTVRFDRPTAGPLLLGVLRFFGLGLMRPLER